MTDLAKDIKNHNALVGKNSRKRVCYRTVCANCKKSEGFAPHELRSRWLRYIVGNAVRSAKVFLARWRCCHCNRSFTDYPDFRTTV